MPKNTSQQGENGFDKEYKLMCLYIDNAKTYVQLSVGALVLTITFVHEVSGVPAGERIPPDGFLIASWIAFLVAILSGAFYQFLAVRYLEIVHLEEVEDKNGKKGIVRRLAENPGDIYNVMMPSFYIGALLFTGSAVRRILWPL